MCRSRINENRRILKTVAAHMAAVEAYCSAIDQVCCSVTTLQDRSPAESCQAKDRNSLCVFPLFDIYIALCYTSVRN
ncbi:MAG: hypothetical protein J6128_05960 [Clostridia bacterium]|nr:hypothetical protein [Clostridia bacterium]